MPPSTPKTATSPKKTTAPAKDKPELKLGGGNGKDASFDRLDKPSPSARKTEPLGTPKGEKGTPRKGKTDAKKGAKGKKSERSLDSVPEDKGLVASPEVKDTPTTVYIGDKKIEYLSKELLTRQPLDEKSRSALMKKAGPPKQEVNYERNESHRPIGRADGLSPSRHERVPPAHIVMMFNCYEASFLLIGGDISTLPESDTLDLRSLTSGKVLGRIKITPEKGVLGSGPG